MEGGSLFTPGFLGLNLIGGSVRLPMMQPGVITLRVESMKLGQIPGFGRRYKVRILDTTISRRNQFLLINYHGHRSCTLLPQVVVKHQHIKLLLRQGNFVFGFFLDGQDQQVPVIMNSGQQCSDITQDNDRKIDTNFGPTSGFLNLLTGD